MSTRNVSTQLISYPANGSRKQNAEAGKYIFDFSSGLVTSPSGIIERMSKSLKQIGSQFVNSLFITTSTIDVEIKIGQNILPKSHQLTHIINGISFETLEIKFPNDRVPLNGFSFALLASDSLIFPLSADNLVGFHNPPAETGITANSFVSIFDFLFAGFFSSEIITQNTHASNVMVVDIQVSEDGVNFVSAQSYPIDVLNQSFNIFQNSISHKFIRVRLKSKNTNFHATYRVQLNLER